MAAGSPTASSDFRGPFVDGPPPQALQVDVPPLRHFGPAEARRMLVISWIVTMGLLRAVGRWLWHPRRQRLSEAAAGALVDGVIGLGPMFVKLGQLRGASP